MRLSLLSAGTAGLLLSLGAGAAAAAGAGESSVASSGLPSPRVVMYLTGQHPVPPPLQDVGSVTHILLAFMQAKAFVSGTRPAAGWDPDFFASIPDVRAKFAAGTKVMVAIGGWANSEGFEQGARDDASRARWSAGVAAMVDELGLDGVDIDWEFPGGNGEDYKQVPNASRQWEIAAFHRLLAALRRALGPDKVLAAAVPGLERDHIAFTAETLPLIMAEVDWVNVMTYEMMNRRDNVTKHHSGVGLSLACIDTYLAKGAVPAKVNLGFGFFVKWVQTTDCAGRPDRTPSGHAGAGSGPDSGSGPAPDSDPAIGCPTPLLEDPETGADLGRIGSFSWHDIVPEAVADSFARAQAHGRYDPADGGSRYYWDEDRRLWWTYDDERAIRAKVRLVMQARGLGGVFSWGIGEDGPDWTRYRALVDAVAEVAGGGDERSAERVEL